MWPGVGSISTYTVPDSDPVTVTAACSLEGAVIDTCVTQIEGLAGEWMEIVRVSLYVVCRRMLNHALTHIPGHNDGTEPLSLPCN